MEKFSKKHPGQISSTREDYDAVYPNYSASEQRDERGQQIVRTFLDGGTYPNTRLTEFIDELVACKEFELAGRLLGALGSKRLGRENTTRLLEVLKRPGLGIQALRILKESEENEAAHRLEDWVVDSLIDSVCSNQQLAIMAMRIASEIRFLSESQYARLVSHLTKLQKYNCDPALLSAKHIPERVMTFLKSSCIDSKKSVH